MSESTPPPLARQIGGIAADLRAQAQAESARAGLAAVLHALILSLLARIVGRLETMVALWQAGQLPALPPPAARAATPRPAAPAQPASPWHWLAAFLPAIPAAERHISIHRRESRPRHASRVAPRHAAAPDHARQTAPAEPLAAPVVASRARAWPPITQVTAPRAPIAARPEQAFQNLPWPPHPAMP